MSDDYDDLNDPLEMAIYAHQKEQGEDDYEVDIYDSRGPKNCAELPVHKEVREITQRLDAEIESIAAHRISLDAPAIEMLVRSRYKKIMATRQLYNIAKGETPEDFVEPDKAAPAYVTPKAATGFAVVNAKRRRVIPAPAAPADPVPAPPAYKPAVWNF